MLLGNLSDRHGNFKLWEIGFKAGRICCEEFGPELCTEVLDMERRASQDFSLVNSPPALGEEACWQTVQAVQAVQVAFASAGQGQRQRLRNTEIAEGFADLRSVLRYKQPSLHAHVGNIMATSIVESLCFAFFCESHT